MPIHSSLGIRTPGKVTSQLGIQEVKRSTPKMTKPKINRQVEKGTLKVNSISNRKSKVDKVSKPNVQEESVDIQSDGSSEC
jgi:hypothetical protein